MNRKGIGILLGCLIAIAGLAQALGAQEIRTADRFPMRGKPTTIVVETAPGMGVSDAHVTVVYRPGSMVETCEPVGITGTDGAIEWTPDEPGIACLRATWVDEGGTEHELTRNVSIRFEGVQARGILIAVLAGLILYGTAAFGFCRLRSSDAPDERTQVPST